MYFTNCITFGVDWGSEYIKLSACLFGRGVHTVLNQQSKRLSPSSFCVYNISNPSNTTFPKHWTKESIKECQWGFFEHASTHAKRFPDNAVHGLSNLTGNVLGFTRREILALMIKSLISTAEQGKWKPKQASLVFAVEPWMPRSQRYAIKEACSISEANLISVIDSPVAAAQTYALEKQVFYKFYPKIVAFIDIGSSHTWASVFNFSNGGDYSVVKQLSVSTNFSLGGRVIDEKIAEVIERKFCEKNNIKPPFSSRVKAAFLTEAHRVKERMTISKSVDINLEDLVDDMGVHFTMLLEEFEELIADFIPSIHNLFKDVAMKANLTENEISSIELLGGSSRIPLFNKAIMDWSGHTKLNRTLNSDEAVAIGAGYIGAVYSNSFIIRKVKMSPILSVNVSMVYGDEKVLLFREGQFDTDNLTIDFAVKDLPNNFTIEIDGDTNFFHYFFNISDKFNSTDIITLRFRFNQLSIPILQNATIGKDKVDFAVLKSDWMVTEDGISNSKRFIAYMDHVMEKRTALQQKLSDHEALIYKLREKIDNDGELINVMTHEERDAIKRALDEHLEWASSETKKTVKVVSEKIESLKAATYDPDRRIYERKNRPLAIEKLQNKINETRLALDRLPKLKPWIPPDKISALHLLHKSTIQWLDEKLRIMKLENVTDNPTITSAEIDRRRDSLDRELDNVESIPQPTPNPDGSSGTVKDEEDENESGFGPKVLKVNTSSEENITTQIGRMLRNIDKDKENSEEIGHMDESDDDSSSEDTEDSSDDDDEGLLAEKELEKQDQGINHQQHENEEIKQDQGIDHQQHENEEIKQETSEKEL